VKAYGEVEEPDVRRVSGHARKRVLDRRALGQPLKPQILLIGCPAVVRLRETRLTNIFLLNFEYNKFVTCFGKCLFEFFFGTDPLDTVLDCLRGRELGGREGVGVVGDFGVG
jgi:hypothetical protein